MFEILKSTETPAGNTLLHKDGSSQRRKSIWNYRAEVGILRYIKGYTQPEILMDVHKCAIFFNNSRLVHKLAIRCNAEYLSSTSTYVDLPDGNQWLTTSGKVYKTYKEKVIECYIDSQFASGWDQVDANNA